MINMNVSSGAELEKQGSLVDCKNLIDEYGMVVDFYIRQEADITRDKYNSIEYRSLNQTETKITLKAFPVTFQPTRSVLERAGIREDCECLIYTAMLDWNNCNIDFENIDLVGRTSVILKGNTYHIKEKALVNNFLDTFLYITFALKRI